MVFLYLNQNYGILNFQFVDSNEQVIIKLVLFEMFSQRKSYDEVLPSFYNEKLLRNSESIILSNRFGCQNFAFGLTLEMADHRSTIARIPYKISM